MTEQRVTLETAKLAKEKGFDIPSGRFYRESTLGHYLINPEYAYDFDILAPTQSMLQKWIREKHRILVIVTPEIIISNYSKYTYSIILLDNDLRINHTNIFISKDKDSSKFFLSTTYELALEAGLQEALKLITEEK